jgi:heme oxygenase
VAESAIPTKKIPLSLRNLQHLGMTVDQINKLSVCTRLPTISDFPSAIAVIYVLEGATLGGRTISKHLKSSISVYPDSRGAFFSSYLENIGQMWETFRDGVNELVWDEREQS